MFKASDDQGNELLYTAQYNEEENQFESLERMRPGDLVENGMNTYANEARNPEQIRSEISNLKTRINNFQDRAPELANSKKQELVNKGHGGLDNFHVSQTDDGLIAFTSFKRNSDQDSYTAYVNFGQVDENGEITCKQKEMSNDLKRENISSDQLVLDKAIIAPTSSNYMDFIKRAKEIPFSVE